MDLVKTIILILLLIVTPPAALAVDVFSHDAETTPICCSDTSTYLWSNGGVQSGVTRVSTFAKSGSWGLRHEVILPAGSDPQTGKVLKFYDSLANSGLLDSQGFAYLSNWFYLPSSGNAYFSNQNGGTGSNSNWEIFNNHFEWKCVNGNGIDCGIGAKIGLAFVWYQGTPRWMLNITDEKFIASPTGNTCFAANTLGPLAKTAKDIGNNDKLCTYVDTSFQMPFDTWVFLEVKLTPKQQGGRIEVWTGTATTGLIKIFDLSDANLNTLTMHDSGGTQWSNNTHLYHSAGNYISNGHAAGTYLVYTDDHKITTTQVGPTLPEFGGGTPAQVNRIKVTTY